MANFDVVEIFESINGEGARAGELAVFVRFKGCNLKCSYCDTSWANTPDAKSVTMTEDEIFEKVKQSNITNVTLTGGEPLFRDNVKILLKKFASDNSISVEIETNGSVALNEFADIKNRPAFTMDYKLPGSGMEKFMCLENFEILGKNDTVKFVVSDENDLNKALDIIRKYSLIGKCNVYFSPVFGRIDPVNIVEFMKKHNINGARLQIQIHKVIWDPMERGV